MGQLLRFQDFENPEQIDSDETANAEVSKSYAEGFAAGQQEAARTQGHLDQAILDALESASFAYAEARRDLLLQLEPLMAAISEKLVPDGVRAALQPRVMDALSAAMADQLDPKVLLRVHPARLGAFQSLTDTHGFSSVRIQADPALSLDTVQIKSETTETSLNAGELISQMQDAFAGFATQLEELKDHG